MVASVTRGMWRIAAVVVTLSFSPPGWTANPGKKHS